MYSPSWFVCWQRAVSVELARPLVDLRLELADRKAAVDLGIAVREHVEVHAVQHQDLHDVSLRNQPFELAPHLVGRTRLDVGAVVAEQHEVDRVAGALLVAEQRLPGALGVDVNGLRGELGLDLRRVAAREPQRREQPERDRLAVRQVVVGGRLERVAEGVAEVEPAARPVVVRILQADPGLVRRRPSARRASARPGAASSRARPSPAAARARAASRAATRRSRRAPASGTRRRGSCPPGCRCPSCRRSPASTWPTSVVGTATHGTPRR